MSAFTPVAAGIGDGSGAGSTARAERGANVRVSVKSASGKTGNFAKVMRFPPLRCERATLTARPIAVEQRARAPRSGHLPPGAPTVLEGGIHRVPEIQEFAPR